MIVWAKQNGNWTSASIWAFWNENTQQIEDYGQMPQIDDVVYCNGHTITFSDTVLTVKELHNDLNPYTQNEGGSINRTATNATISFNCDFFGDGQTNILNGAGNGIPYIINGNVNDAVIVTGTYQQSTTINGNCKNTCSSGLGGGVYKNLIINGNVLIEEGRRFFLSTASAGTQETRMTINGILSQFGDIAISIGVYPTTIYGKYIVGNGVSFNSNMTLYGEVDLTRNNNKVPMTGNYGLNLQTDSIVFENVDYPNEADVKKDVTYAFGTKTGTLESVTVTNTNTINVYPYKRRNNF